MLLNMPVNHDAFTAVAHVPLRHEVLIPSAELFGVRCAGRRRLAPDMRQANPKHRIDNLRNRFAEDDTFRSSVSWLSWLHAADSVL